MDIRAKNAAALDKFIEELRAQTVNPTSQEAPSTYVIGFRQSGVPVILDGPDRLDLHGKMFRYSNPVEVK